MSNRQICCEAKVEQIAIQCPFIMGLRKRKEKYMADEKEEKVRYVREQKGHSAIIGWLIIGPLTAFILPIYWTVSKNHYWHA